MGIILGGVGIVLLAREKTERGPFQMPACEEFGIEIVSPAIGELVGNTFPVSGKYTSLPKGYEIWVFTTEERNHIKNYWPQERAQVQGNKWYSKVNYLGG